MKTPLFLSLIITAGTYTCFGQASLSSIQGSWRWVKTEIKSPGNIMQSITPSDCNCSKAIELDEKYVSIIEDDKILQKDTYRLSSYQNFDGSTQRIFSSKSLQGELEVQGNSIQIGAIHSLGEIHHYQKTNSNMAQSTQEKKPKKVVFDIQGHRGCRGLLPENSIEGFKKAIDLGVHTLELDIVISKDDKIIVSHDPFFRKELTDDLSITNFYQTNYSEIKKVSVGHVAHPRFKEQQPLKTYKPLLDEVVKICDFHSAKKIRYNIELKSLVSGYGIYYPQPEQYVDLVCTFLKEKNLTSRVTLQSFDVNVLNLLHSKYPEFTVAYLVEKNKDFNNAFEKINFKPQIYSPDYKLIDKALISYLNQNNIKLIPWTVNDALEMKKLIDLGVDGIITDYPNLLIEQLKN